MHRPLFLTIARALEAHDSYFSLRRNCAGVPGLHPYQKLTSAFRILAYGISADLTDEYCRLAKSTALENLRRFVRGVIEVFGGHYLRSPNAEDTARLLAIGEQRGFPGMLGSIDCMHWQWKNCPTAHKGFFVGHNRAPTIILEAVASQDLWIWHSFFGLPGSHNDINVLHRSPVFANLAEGHAPEVNYTINGREYNMGYYLADGIYPQWATFVKTIPNPTTEKNKNFARLQEACRKDVERAFGVLQARFAIVRGPARYWDLETLGEVMTACIILHNMIIEDERGSHVDYRFENMGEMVTPSHEEAATLTQFLQAHNDIRNKQVHCQRQVDLVEHQWQIRGQM
jgi:hypothetical protein